MEKMIAFRIYDDMLQALDEIVASGPGDRSAHIRQALADYIYAQQRKKRYLDALAVADDEKALA